MVFVNHCLAATMRFDRVKPNLTNPFLSIPVELPNKAFSYSYRKLSSFINWLANHWQITIVKNFDCSRILPRGEEHLFYTAELKDAIIASTRRHAPVCLAPSNGGGLTGIGFTDV